MNNDNDLNLHNMTKLSGWLRYSFFVFFLTNVLFSNSSTVKPFSTSEYFRANRLFSLSLSFRPKPSETNKA